jgi:lipopolysaccharide transport system permease protein
VIDDEGQAVGLSIACAVVPFQLVMMSVASSLRSVELRRAIVANMKFRRTLIPISTTMTEGIGFLSCLVLLPVMMLAYGVAPTPAILLLPVAVVLTFVLAVALAYPAKLVGMWMPELSLIVVSAVRTLFFLAPGLVALNEVFGRTHDLLQLNPLTGIFETYRSILLEGTAPAAWMVLVPLGYALVLLALFVPLFRREQRHFAKLLL